MHTQTHTTHTLAHTTASPHRLCMHVHCIHICIYLHTNALFMLCDFIETATVAPLYIPSAISEILHWTTAHHLPHPLLCVPALLKHNTVHIICMSDGHVSNYYQDCTLCITLEWHVLLNFVSHIFHAPPGPLFSIRSSYNLLTIVTLLVVFISVCVHITYFLIIYV